ncbi:hypothetical protein C7271_17445 [filamentous cyanobacterium CCP5]|nr:hypothetical protein C7271_17445 [filamentous cyanobacterium CCP5]
MTLDIESIRPRLLSIEVYQCLDELRRFRHVFRNSYTVELNPQRMAIVVNQAKKLEGLNKADLA